MPGSQDTKSKRTEVASSDKISHGRSVVIECVMATQIMTCPFLSGSKLNAIVLNSPLQDTYFRTILETCLFHELARATSYGLDNAQEKVRCGQTGRPNNPRDRCRDIKKQLCVLQKDLATFGNAFVKQVP